MTSTLTCENTLMVNTKDNNYSQFIWGSIEPRNGDIVLYPNPINQKIEDAYLEFLSDPDKNTINVPELFNISIYFKNPILYSIDICHK